MNIKIRAHESFFIRKGWLNKGLKNVDRNSRIFNDKNIKPTDELGIGTNMVKSLRYWLQAVRLTWEDSRRANAQEFTDLGRLIWQNDRYIEEDGTLWLLHFSLATNMEQATAWYWFFNVFKMNEFTKEDFVEGLDSYIRFDLKYEDGVSTKSIEDDFNCIINTYISRAKLNPKKDSPENNIDCPLGELELLDVLDKRKRVFKKVTPRKDTIHPIVVLAAIIKQCETEDGDYCEIKISKLLNSECSVGKVFNLDTLVLSYYLDKLQDMGYLRVIRTAGLDVVKLIKPLTFNECIQKYYDEINN